MTLVNRPGPWCLAGLVLVSGCSFYRSSDDVVDAAPAPAWQRVAILDPSPTRDLDVLFVVDTSGSMAEEQELLANGMQAMVGQLELVDGGLPDLHVGVISSDVGAGPFQISSCIPDGDNGRLQVEARRFGCATPTGSFILDVADGAGGRTTNYMGSLVETFLCISELGTDGCAFEQHLESMRRALNGSVPFNAGFLRADAHLLIVILADEDDCSTADTSMFDTSQNAPSDPLGPLSSFRCFEFGVDCEVGNAEPRVVGARQGCRPREDSPYMYGVAEYVDFVRSLKVEAGMVSVATIVGPAAPVAVGVDVERPDNAQLEPVCQSFLGVADPAVRLGWFADQFAARNVQTTICNQNIAAALSGAATLVSNVLSTPCLTAPIAGDLAQLAASCRAFDVVGLDTGAEQRTPLAPCTASGAFPCVRFGTDDRCTLNPARASVSVERGGTTPPGGTQVVVECPR